MARVRDYRPRCHLSAPSGWINDPNGPIWWRGRYHLFFQRNPATPVWAPAIHWGHAVSSDLVHWEHLEDALAPSPAGADAGGCWSGCVVDDDGVPTAVYSGLRQPSDYGAETVCLARGDGELVRWRKDERNPVLAGPPAGLDLAAFRDPFVWRDDDTWTMVIGAGLTGDGGAVLRFRSPDLLDWAYDGIVLTEAALDSPLARGRAWECPQLFPLGDRHVLLLSIQGREPQQTLHSVAVVGSYGRGRFEPEHVERFDHGADLYAPATMLDPHGRRLAWGWSWEARDEAAALEQGWAGTLTLPRVLTLRQDGRLWIAPASELEALRGAHETHHEQPLDGELAVATRGDRLELAVVVAPNDAAAIRVQLCASPDGEERTLLEWDRDTGLLSIDRSHSSLDPRAAGGRHSCALELGAGDLELRVFVDASIVEVFANGRCTLTERIYPTRDDSTGVALSAFGGAALLRALDVWQLKPAG